MRIRKSATHPRFPRFDPIIITATELWLLSLQVAGKTRAVGCFVFAEAHIVVNPVEAFFPRGGLNAVVLIHDMNEGIYPGCNIGIGLKVSLFVFLKPFAV